MEYLVSAFQHFGSNFDSPQNLQFTGVYEHEPPHTAYTNAVALQNHQKTLHHAFIKYLYPTEIELIENGYRRSDVTLESILKDFFDNDVPQHDIPFDTHVQKGLDAMEKAFTPPKRARPVHILDVQHGYPYKWQVNSEPPFSTDRYFLDQRPTFQEFIDKHEYEHIDVDDFNRRYQHLDSDTFEHQVTPAKFGFQKQAIFSWTRRWHHVIKSGFTDFAGLNPDSHYVMHRFIFPMLLHTKTAIVKKDDLDKMRTIWGCSKPWIISDTILWWEYIAWIKLNPGVTPMLWGFETFTGGWMRLNHALFSNHLVFSFLTLDWKRFDKRAYFTLIAKIMDRARNFLDFDNGYVPTHNYPEYTNWNETQASRIQNLWLWSLENLFNAEIVLPNGDKYKRHFAGIPSGLFTTQLLDSWYNYTMIATLLSAVGLDPDTCIIKVQGDDSIIRLGVLILPSQHDLFLHKLQELADHYFASLISTEKSEMDNELNHREVLSYRHKNGLPYRDEIKMLAQFYHTKARNPTPQITMAQCIGFAYASCGNHQRVLYALEDVYDYYKRQGFSPNRAGLTAIFGNSPDIIDFPFELDHFPTQSEIKRYFLNTDYNNESTKSKTWPLSLFVNPPCT